MIGLGDYVRDDYGRTGRVTAIHHGCPENDLWLSLQQIPREEEGRWISVLIHGGGLATMPDTAAERIEPFEFKNHWAEFYFGKESE